MKIAFCLILLFASPAFAANIKVAITVDDLPTHGPLPPGTTREDIARQMVSTLKKHKVPEAYAFINAGKVEQKNESMEVLEIWKKAGFRFGNHAYLHEDINKVSLEEFKKAIDLNEPMLQKLSAGADWKFFRYPYLREGETLETRNAIRSYLQRKEYKIAQVTIDFEDWSWNGPYARCRAKNDSKSIEWLKKTYLKNGTDMLARAEKLSHALFQRSISHVLLLHIGAFDALMLDALLTEYEKKGVTFVTLPEAQKDEIYAINPDLAEKWGSELTYQIMKSRNLKPEDTGLEKYRDYPEKELEAACL